MSVVTVVPPNILHPHVIVAAPKYNFVGLGQLDRK
jgi:hypothetical protein